MLKRLLLPTLLFAIASASFAALEWKKDTIVYTATPADEEITATFHFVNAGTEPVTLLDTKSSCGCTVPELEKRAYAPGEFGTVKAKFTFGERTGEQLKNIMLYTDAKDVPTYPLTLQVTIPPFISTEPQLLFWTRNEEPKAKITIVKILSPEPITLGELEFDHNLFEAELKPIDEGLTYRLSVKPLKTDSPMQDRIFITTSATKKDGSPRKVMIIGQVY